MIECRLPRLAIDDGEKKPSALACEGAADEGHARRRVSSGRRGEVKGNEGHMPRSESRQTVARGAMDDLGACAVGDTRCVRASSAHMVGRRRQWSRVKDLRRRMIARGVTGEMKCTLTGAVRPRRAARTLLLGALAVAGSCLLAPASAGALPASFGSEGARAGQISTNPQGIAVEQWPDPLSSVRLM
jgi:hypothetical protein